MKPIVPWLLAGAVAAATSCSDQASDTVPPGHVSNDALALCAKVTTCLGWMPPEYAWGMDGLCALIARDRAGEGPSSYSVPNAARGVMLDCIAEASDCAAVHACVTATPEQQAVCDTAPSGDGVCAGNVYVSCETIHESEPGVFAVDCAVAGLICNVDACVLDTCDPVIDGEEHCEGNVLVTCSHGDISGLVSNDCSSESMGGSICGTTASGSLDCVGTGAACDNLFERSCEGTVKVTCQSQKEARFDCSQVEVMGYTYYCHGGQCVAGEECESGHDSCDGTVARFCMDGVWMDLDCAAYGFSGCTIDSSDPPSTWAYCTE